MSIHAQGKGNRGSLKWMQVLVNDKPELLNREILRHTPKDKKSAIKWLSPVKPEYKEYRDEDFLKILGCQDCAGKLKEFWPNMGPQWDGLGKLEDGTLLIVEAKAHISEVFTFMGANAPSSRRKIRAAFDSVVNGYGIKTPYSWEGPFYQYANRIAHLYFLNSICGKDAYLVFINILGDKDMDGPCTAGEWKKVTGAIHTYLGIKDTKIQKRIIEIYLPVTSIKP